MSSQKPIAASPAGAAHEGGTQNVTGSRPLDQMKGTGAEIGIGRNGGDYDYSALAGFRVARDLP